MPSDCQIVLPQKDLFRSGEATGVLRPQTLRSTAVNAEEGVLRLSWGACYLDREERETDDVGSLCFVSSKLSLEEAAAADRLFERRRRRNTPTDRWTDVGERCGERGTDTAARRSSRLSVDDCSWFTAFFLTSGKRAPPPPPPRDRGREGEKGILFVTHAVGPAGGPLRLAMAEGGEDTDRRVVVGR